MKNDKLVEYIRNELAMGYQIPAIKLALKNSRWDDKTIDDSIKAASLLQMQTLAQAKNAPATDASAGLANAQMQNDMQSAQYAGFWIRFLAELLDYIIVALPLYALFFFIGFTLKINSLFYVAELIVAAIVIYLEGTKGAAPGKMICRLKVVNASGNVIGVPNAILRYLGKILSALTLMIGFIMIAFSDKKQGLHDRIAKTFVIKK